MPHMQVPAWRALLITCCAVLLSTSVASAQFTYRTIVPKLPQVSVVEKSRVTGLTDTGTMVGLYKPPNGPWGSWLYRSGKQTYTKVIQPGWRLYIEDVTDVQQKMVGYGEKNNVLHSVMKWGNGSSLFKVIRTSNGDETTNCALAGNTADAICMYWDETVEHERGIYWNSAGFQEGPIIDLEVPDLVGWAVKGTASSYPINLAGIVNHHPPDGQERQDGFVEIDGVVSLVVAPCGGHTIVQDLSYDGLMAVTCFDEGIVKYLSYAYDGVTWEPLMVPGSRETVVRRVNNLGQYAGYYVDANGLDQGFVATPIP